MADPLFRKIDSYQLPVSDLESALTFYSHKLGQELVWRTDTSAGLRLPEGDGELVLQTERPGQETDILVADVPAAVDRFVAAGGRVIRPPFDIQIGKCAVVTDPFGNVLVLLDASKGLLITGPGGAILGNQEPR